MTKRIPALFLVAVILLTAVQVPVPAAAELPDEAVTRLLNDLIGFLYQEEIMCGDLQWVLDAFERFDRERSWESLLLARAQLSLAEQDIASLKMDEAAMTADDALLFLNTGIDVSFMEKSAASFQLTQSYCLNICNNLQNDIMLKMFSEEDWKIAMRFVDFVRQWTECEFQYYANMTVWTLAKIGNAEVTDPFNELLKEYCPKFYAHQAASPADEEENENASSTILRRRDELEEEYQIILGAFADRDNRLNDIIDAGSWELLSKDLMAISGTPVFLSFPPNYSTGTVFRYYWTENGEIIPSPVPGSVPERIPDMCTIRVEGVTLEDARNYQQLLSYEGMEPFTVTEEDSSLMLSYMYSDSLFTVAWQDQALTIRMLQNPLLLIPDWYYMTLLKMYTD